MNKLTPEQDAFIHDERRNKELTEEINQEIAEERGREVQAEIDEQNEGME